MAPQKCEHFLELQYYRQDCQDGCEHHLQPVQTIYSGHHTSLERCPALPIAGLIHPEPMQLSASIATSLQAHKIRIGAAPERCEQRKAHSPLTGPMRADNR